MWYGCMIWNGGKSSVEYDSVLFNGVTCYIAVLLRTVLIDKSVPEGSGYKTGVICYGTVFIHPIRNAFSYIYQYDRVDRAIL